MIVKFVKKEKEKIILNGTTLISEKENLFEIKNAHILIYFRFFMAYN